MKVFAAPDWHYPRRDFTDQVYKALIGGGTNAFRLFGPRRIGKTEFLFYDLGLRAVSEGHLAVYVSLWQNIDAPVETIADGCERALRVLPGLRPKQWLTSGSAYLDLATGPIKTGIKKDWKPAPDLDPWARLRDILDRMRNPEKPAFLFLDEFQSINDHPDGKTILNKLAAELPMRGNGLKVVFTGSSIKQLRLILGRENSDSHAFGGFTQPLSLPKLGDDFVTHQLHAARANGHLHPIPEEEARRAFEACGRLPQQFRAWLLTRNRNPQATLEESLFDQRDLEDFQRQFDSPQPRARLMARLIAEGIEQPQGKIGAAWWRAFTGISAPTGAARGTDLATLIRKDIAYKLDGTKGYGMTDPAFGKWITMRPKTAFEPGPQP